VDLGHHRLQSDAPVAHQLAAAGPETSKLSLRFMVVLRSTA
jgi:hypothetical protein